MPPKRPQPPRPTGTGTSAEPPRKRAKPTSSVGSVGSAVALEALADATATAPGHAAEAKLAQRASPPVATDEAPAAMPEGSLAVEVHFFSDDKHGPHIYKYWSGDVTYGHVLNDFCEEAQLTLGDLTFKAVDGTPITADTPLIPGAHARRGCDLHPIKVLAWADPNFEAVRPPAEAAPLGSVSSVGSAAAKDRACLCVQFHWTHERGYDIFDLDFFNAVTYSEVLHAFCTAAELELGDTTFKAVDGTLVTTDTPLTPTGATPIKILAVTDPDFEPDWPPADEVPLGSVGSGGSVGSADAHEVPATAVATAPGHYASAQAPAAVTAPAVAAPKVAGLTPQAVVGPLAADAGLVPPRGAGPAPAESGPNGAQPGTVTDDSLNDAIDGDAPLSSLGSVSFVTVRSATVTPLEKERPAARRWQGGLLQINRRKKVSFELEPSLSAPAVFAIKVEDQEAQPGVGLFDEVLDWRSPVRDWRSPVRDWQSLVRDWRSSVRDWRNWSEIGGARSEIGGARSEIGGALSAIGGGQSETGGARSEIALSPVRDERREIFGGTASLPVIRLALMVFCRSRPVFRPSLSAA